MNKKLLIIGFVWPEPNSTAAGNRILQLIEVFKKNDYQITFVSTATKSDLSIDLHSLNIQTYDILLNDSNFDILINEINPDIVLFDRFLTEEQFGWRVVKNLPNAIRILDTEDLHFLRHARHQAYKNNDEISYTYLVNELAKREIASIYRCDLSLIISKYEIELLVDTFKIDTILLLYLPFLQDNINKNKITSYPSFQERNDFMTIGNFKHKPNWNSVLYLKEIIWPLIRNKLPNTRINIYGAYSPDKVKQLHDENEGFIIKGWVKNAEKAFTKSRVCLAPLQFGAGLKGKLIDAMQYGTPSITTSIGAEAMHDNLSWNGFIEDDPTEFAIKSAELYSNENTWNNAQENGIFIINQCFDKSTFSIILINAIIKIKKNLKKRRLKNFTGLMLQHHTLQSTQYLSKWIEEKNK
jgi:glycosyltransferase involved in cell wall biosynthesis